jgi:glycosyltransferase involved in cell wall biosynthesis
VARRTAALRFATKCGVAGTSERGNSARLARIYHAHPASAAIGGRSKWRGQIFHTCRGPLTPSAPDDRLRKSGPSGALPKPTRVSVRQNARAMTVVAIVFWVSVGLLLSAHLGYPALLGALAPLRRRKPAAATSAAAAVTPDVSVIVAAYAEQEVIAERVSNLRALDYPAERLEVLISCDGSPDETAIRARQAGADVVLELPRGGKIRAQDAAVEKSRGQIVAFSDANVRWEPDALRALVAPFDDRRVGYVCGQVAFVNEHGTNQEGVYWRYEMAVRELESRVRSVTGGNGAIYATRRDSYLVVDPIMGHDLSFPFNMVKRGWLAVYAPQARASEKMVPSIEGEFARKRRMMSHGWPIVLRGGMLSPRGYDPLYAFMIVSHRLLRYLSPFLHLLALGASIALIGQGWVYVVAVVVQAAVLLAALLAPLLPIRPLLLARYYVLTTASLAAGLWDWLAHGTHAGWEPAEGTR